MGRKRPGETQKYWERKSMRIQAAKAEVKVKGNSLHLLGISQSSGILSSILQRGKLRQGAAAAKGKRLRQRRAASGEQVPPWRAACLGEGFLS